MAHFLSIPMNKRLPNRGYSKCHYAPDPTNEGKSLLNRGGCTLPRITAPRHRANVRIDVPRKSRQDYYKSPASHLHALRGSLRGNIHLP